MPAAEVDLSDGTVWYTPLHYVITHNTPGKVYIVYDCPAKLNGVSLNNQTMQGPALTTKLISVLLHFRQFKYAIMADIQAMYHQVRIPVQDTNALRFTRRDCADVMHRCMAVHLFAGRCCTSTTVFALKRTVQDYEVSDLVKQMLLNCFYVDDLLTLVKFKTEALEVIHDCKVAVKNGGFNLTKYVTKDNELLAPFTSMTG